MAGITDAIVTLIIKAKNAVSPAVDEAASSLYDAQKRADDLVSELARLDKQAQQLRDFETLSTQTAALGTAMRDAQANAARLQDQLRNTANPSATLRAEFADARTAAQLATSEYKRQQTELSRLGSSLARGGIDTKNLGAAESTLKQRIADTSTEAKKAATDMAQYAAAQEKTKRSSEGLSGTLGKLKTLLFAGAGAAALKGLVSVTDQYKQLEGQLKQVTDGQDDLNTTFDKLHQLANDTRAPLDAAVNLYAKLKQNTANLAVSNDQLLAATRAISQTFAVSGASADEANRAIIQLSQGFAKGSLQLQDLRSVMEASPRFTKALTDGLGVTNAELLKMASTGTLSAEKVLAALQKTAVGIEDDYKKMPQTVGQALTTLQNDVITAFGSQDVTGPLIEGINEFSKTLSDPGMVSALSSLARAVFQLGSWMANGAKASVNFAQALGENVAAAVSGDGGAAHSLEYLEAKLEAVKTALHGSWWDMDVGMIFTSSKELANMETELTARIEAMKTAQKVANVETTAGKEATEAKTKADQTAVAVLDDLKKEQDAVNKSLKNLGIDSNLVLTGISSATQGLLDSYADASQSIHSLGATTKQQGEIMEQAFQKVLAAADSDASFSALKEKLKAAFDAGAISADQYKAEIDALREKQDELTASQLDNVDANADQQAAQDKTADSSERLADALTTAADANLDLLDSSQQVSSGFAAVRDQFAATSDAAVALYDQLANANAKVANGAMSWQQYMKDAAAAEKEVSAAISRQQQRVDQAMQMQNGNLGVFITYAQQALANATLLGDQQLSGLRSALDSARSQMQGLKNDAASTLSSLESALAQAQGNAAEVEKLRYQQQIAQLTDKLATAQTAGDRDAIADLQKALTVAKQLHDTNVQNAALAAAQAASKSQASATGDTKPATAAPGVAITLKGPGKTSANVTANSQQDANALLKLLEEAGLRTT